VHAPRKGKTAASAVINIASIGIEVDKIDVTIGPQFLNLFSEHLYSSPNKAFEELVSNAWDAGATAVYVTSLTISARQTPPFGFLTTVNLWMCRGSKNCGTSEHLPSELTHRLAADLRLANSGLANLQLTF